MVTGVYLATNQQLDIIPWWNFMSVSLQSAFQWFFVCFHLSLVKCHISHRTLNNALKQKAAAEKPSHWPNKITVHFWEPTEMQQKIRLLWWGVKSHQKRDYLIFGQPLGLQFKKICRKIRQIWQMGSKSLLLELA